MTSTPELSMGGAGSIPTGGPYFLPFDLKWGTVYAANNPSLGGKPPKTSIIVLY